ncbi:hypothetical protein [Nonomuraea salmonea]|uniref:hypothetical protein n=1 Tax=Nonomuraea salmonea TaxID=46181 RepID=UPI0031ECB774
MHSRIAACKRFEAALRRSLAFSQFLNALIASLAFLHHLLANFVRLFPLPWEAVLDGKLSDHAACQRAEHVDGGATAGGNVPAGETLDPVGDAELVCNDLPDGENGIHQGLQLSVDLSLSDLGVDFGLPLAVLLTGLAFWACSRRRPRLSNRRWA